MLRIDGQNGPGPLAKLGFSLQRALSGSQPVIVEVTGTAPPCRFVCTSYREFKRAANLYLKEPGTIAWLQEELRPGDHFLDVGANVGVFSIFAALLHGGSVSVSAVEPHLVNAARLMENVQASGVGDRVTVLNCALAEAGGFSDFNYRSWLPASSNSQLARNTDSHGRQFDAAARELKAVASVDELVNAGAVPRPNLVKIDVDGIEPQVLSGMKHLLTGDGRPRSLQVEVGPQTLSIIETQLEQRGYRREARHFSKGGERRLAEAGTEREVSHNVIFRPA